MTAPNAIERLRAKVGETRERYGFPDIEDRYPGAVLETFLLRDAVELLAAVDALYQAAKPLRALYEDLDRIMGLGHALRQREPEVREAIKVASREVAAAVRRVEGQA